MAFLTIVWSCSRCVIHYHYTYLQIYIHHNVSLETKGFPLELKIKFCEFQQCLTVLNEFVMVGPQAASEPNCTQMDSTVQIHKNN